MQLDLSGLEAMEAVVKCGGFGRAAERLHKVQSAVSHQVQKLEEQLGIKLFDRTGYRVRLTPAGEAVLAEGRRLLSDAEHLRSIARQFSQGWEPGLSVVVDGMLPLDPVLAALNGLASEKVPTRIQIKVGFLRGVQASFEKDDGDLMVSIDYAASPYLYEEALPAMDCMLCVAATHPLASAKMVSLPVLQKHVELSVQLASEEQGYDRHLFGCERSFFLASFHAKKEALLMGVGFGWMPVYLIRKEIRSRKLREVRYVGGSRYRITPKMVYRTDRGLGRAGQRFVELLRSAWKPYKHNRPASAQ